MLLLDTNIVSYWMRGDRSVTDRLRLHQPCDLSISTITLAEINYGIEKSPVKKKERREKINQIKTHLELYSFDEESAYQYASVRVYLEKKGIMISERDLQIASIALANHFDVVTHNAKEFRRVPHLTIHDWKE
jgi:tRNA(fMet)-specific endonuclease VapC